MYMFQVKPPFVPNINNEHDDDTSNFDTMFTDETPNFTPVNEGSCRVGEILIIPEFK